VSTDNQKLVSFLRLVYRITANQETTPGWRGFVFSLVAMVSIPLLFGTSVALGGSSPVLVGALSIQLLYGLWIFTRLLIHRN
jgi:hypothetical protein